MLKKLSSEIKGLFFCYLHTFEFTKVHCFKELYTETSNPVIKKKTARVIFCVS
jgi:hypothetical protein